ncbi:leucine-rich repeat-containing protein 56-like [Saccoglossus kowalevskii]|uniref:Leucine-rich repeat-containing protein 56-like isoform X1 n=1 Tax=Saccoglossus kowalevskii TaxID=10224 RepID=A0ABM0ME51_SACKO|nr:PREDICTED: leucine-rich repeat-containing protein 56-like isoform X1 [Saccoglossus kowalevskii]XP_006818293.1 PREDICTED: leucine-rich repeat-containing protein 56-like isoform X2 [Saccoglossus kowalevskii]
MTAIITSRVMESPDLQVINIDSRPGTSYQRHAVHITEYQDFRVNPEPIVLEETDILLEEYLSPLKLKNLTGVDDLDDVKFLEMRVDTTETSLGNFGSMLPNLKQLKLNDSIIASVRDLGTSLRNLTVLWMGRCGLTDLDGISSMSNLQELYLAYNELTDVSPCSMLDNLQLLDVEGNNIDDIAQVEFLALCSNLHTLTLEGNPVCLSPTTDYNPKESGRFDYRASIKKALPSIVILDEEALDVVSSSLGKAHVNQSTDWLIVNHAIKDYTDSTESLEDSVDSGRPGSSKGRPSSATGRRPVTSGGRSATRLGTAAGRRSGASDRPSSSGSDVQVVQDDSSDLTHGNSSPLCGNPIRALRQRKKYTSPEIPYAPAPNLFSQYHHKPEHSYDLEEEIDNDSKEDVFDELREWKKDYEKHMAERLTGSQAQVLKITHSDDSDSSSNEDNDTGIETSPPNSVSPDSGTRLYSPPTSLTPRQPSSNVPPKLPARPKSAGGFHLRKYRMSSSTGVPMPVDIDGTLESRLKNLRLRTDEEVVLSDKEDVKSPNSPSFEGNPALPLGSVNDRPYSGPVVSNRKFKSDIVVNKTQPKIIDQSQPVIRASTLTPPTLAQRFAGLARPSTARAALQRLPNKPMKPV